MLTKKVMVHLDTGTRIEHTVEAKDEASYVDWVNICAEALVGDQKGILGFTTPFCIYKVKNIIAIEFLDPMPLSNKLPIGFKRQKCTTAGTNTTDTREQ